MIQKPRRSVTRFFIPLIDVLTLLFCIFLLLPYVKPEDKAAADAPMPPLKPIDPGDPKEAAKRIAELEKEIERLRKEQVEVVQHLTVRTLEIDKDSGQLYYYAGGERLEIRNRQDADRLIQRDRRELLLKEKKPDLYYLFLLPRGKALVPSQRQVDNYRDWFKNAAHGFDTPRS